MPLKALPRSICICSPCPHRSHACSPTAQSSRACSPRERSYPASPGWLPGPASRWRTPNPSSPRRTSNPLSPRRISDPASPRGISDPAFPRGISDPASSRRKSGSASTNYSACPSPIDRWATSLAGSIDSTKEAKSNPPRCRREILSIKKNVLFYFGIVYVYGPCNLVYYKWYIIINGVGKNDNIRTAVTIMNI